MLSRIKIGDQVQVISGKDKGKRGEVLDLKKSKGLVRVRGICVQMKHKKPRMAGQKGAIEKVEGFVNQSKIMPICPKTNQPCRVRVKVLENGKKVRVSHRSGAEL